MLLTRKFLTSTRSPLLLRNYFAAGKSASLTHDCSPHSMQNTIKALIIMKKITTTTMTMATDTIISLMTGEMTTKKI